MQITANMAGIIKVAVAYGFGSSAFGGTGGSSSSLSGTSAAAGYSGHNTASGTTPTMTRDQEMSASFNTANAASLGIGGGAVLKGGKLLWDGIKGALAARGVVPAVRGLVNGAYEGLKGVASPINDYAPDTEKQDTSYAIRNTAAGGSKGAQRAARLVAGGYRNDGDLTGIAYDEGKRQVKNLVTKIPYVGKPLRMAYDSNKVNNFISNHF